MKTRAEFYLKELFSKCTKFSYKDEVHLVSRALVLKWIHLLNKILWFTMSGVPLKNKKFTHPFVVLFVLLLWSVQSYINQLREEAKR